MTLSVKKGGFWIIFWIYVHRKIYDKRWNKNAKMVDLLRGSTNFRVHGIENRGTKSNTSNSWKELSMFCYLYRNFEILNFFIVAEPSRMAYVLD